MKATIVFEKNWNSIHERNEDGSNKYRYIINVGSSRSSKTVSLIQLHHLYALQNPNKRMTIWRDTKHDCRQTILQDAIRYLRENNMYQKGFTLNKTEGKFFYNNFSSVEFLGTDDEEKIHGLTQDCCWVNEPYNISLTTFNQLDQRTSDFVFIDYNPKKGHWVEDLMKDKRSLIIHSTFKDNPFCPAESRNKILSYQPLEMSEAVLSKVLNTSEAFKYNFEQNIKQLNKNQIVELQRCLDNENKNSASKFNWEVYGLGLKSEKPNRIFKWSEISENDYHQLDAPVYYGCDWGAVDPWAIIEVKYYDGAIYVHEKNYDSENIIREKLQSNQRNEITNYELSEGVSEGIVIYMFKKLGILEDRPIICDSNRPLKIAMLRRFGYNSHVAYKGTIIDRIDLMNNIKIYYTQSSNNIKHEQENYSRKVDRHGITLEEPEDNNNHTMDAISYVVLHLQREGVLRVL